MNDTHALLAELAPCGSSDGQTCLTTVVLLVDDKKNVSVVWVLLGVLKISIHPTLFQSHPKRVDNRSQKG